ncbi:2-dehydro-3-deoxygalactonokinase [Dyadobacter sp. NIV53]|uniref:2-dehydro-3-deoxygalactonokinase n=1 Tax=Dyadobacter sp. NIV53 TaxID=2861765 RepID=UPI001C88D9A7|nr:2-dehydro-3-deoxygalactonokinase [Dyadobacter sp. NIV53]
MKNYLLCCDWGTTSFRLRLVNMENQEVIGEILSMEGVALTFDNWKALDSNFSDRRRFFIDHLQKQITLLENKFDVYLDGVAIVISGMASSSIGMHEIPYSNLPFDLDGNQLNVYRIDSDDSFMHDILLISGVKSEHDVMRGEETQLIGLAELTDLSVGDKTNVIFPGTHSKHLFIQNKKLTGFQTFMTGEIFKIISTHSILKDSIELSVLPDFSEDELAAFRLGVREADSTGILKGLFRVRTNQLFNKLSKKENALYLSGLLIGSEITNLLDEIHAQLVLCSGNNLFELYKLALDESGLSERTTTVSSDMADRATVAGQIKIFRNQAFILNNINL